MGLNRRKPSQQANTTVTDIPGLCGAFDEFYEAAGHFIYDELHLDGADDSSILDQRDDFVVEIPASKSMASTLTGPNLYGRRDEASSLYTDSLVTITDRGVSTTTATSENEGGFALLQGYFQDPFCRSDDNSSDDDSSSSSDDDSETRDDSFTMSDTLDETLLQGTREESQQETIWPSSYSVSTTVDDYTFNRMFQNDSIVEEMRSGSFDHAPREASRNRNHGRRQPLAENQKPSFTRTISTEMTGDRVLPNDYGIVTQRRPRRRFLCCNISAVETVMVGADGKLVRGRARRPRIYNTVAL